MDCSLGTNFRLIQLVSALGLALFMLLGVVTRLHVRDSFQETTPAAVLLLVNVYIAWYVWQTRLFST